MQTEYIRKLNQSNLILSLETECQDNDAIGMFYYNQIPTFLSVKEQKKNGIQQYCYDITGKLSLDQKYMSKNINLDELCHLLTAVDQASLCAADYMLSEDCIILEPEYIFFNSEGKIFFCYVPDLERELWNQLERFMEYLLQKIEHKDQKTVQFAYGIYECIVQGTCGLHEALQDYQREKRLFSSDMFNEDEKNKKEEKSHNRENLISEEIEKEEGIEKKNEIRNEKLQPANKEPLVEKIKRILYNKIYTDQYEEDEIEVAYEPEPEEDSISNPTVCLISNKQMLQYQFVYQGTDRNRDFHLAGQQAIIGSDKKETDIRIPLPIISRIHARIERDDTGIYIEDLNSTNGTAVNGEQLPYKQKKKLQKGDIISFAGENYSVY